MAALDGSSKEVPAIVTQRSRGRTATRPQKVAALLAQRIVSDITDAGMTPGDPLPHERDMLADYEVARGTLREALRFLEMQGVITIKTGPGGGPVVARPEPRHLASIIAMRLQLDRTSFRSVFEARMVLEPALARLASERMAEAELPELTGCVARMAAELDDDDVFVAENERFHSLVTDAADNHIFALIVPSLGWMSTMTSFGVRASRRTRLTVLKEHDAIAKAIVARDGDAAAEAMSRHIERSFTYLRKNHPEVLDAPVRWGDL